VERMELLPDRCRLCLDAAAERQKRMIEAHLRPEAISQRRSAGAARRPDYRSFRGMPATPATDPPIGSAARQEQYRLGGGQRQPNDSRSSARFCHDSAPHAVGPPKTARAQGEVSP